MNQPKVSIVVPVYNVEKYLTRCVDSLLNQTLRDIEIILVNDGSPDNCPVICDEYEKKDNRVKVIHKKNNGLGYARNSGIEIATGEYIAFVDSDDFVDVTMYEKLLRYIEDNNLDTCYCRFQKYYPSGKTFAIPEKSKNEIFNGRLEVDKFLMEMIGGEEYGDGKPTYSISACKSLYSADLIRKYQISFVSEREVASEDLFFNIDYLNRAEKVGYINEMLYYYFFNTKSVTKSYSHEKYIRIKNAMKYLPDKISIYYPYNFFSYYCNGQMLRFIKVIFTFEVARKDKSYFKIRKLLKKECNDPLLNFIKSDYSSKRLPFRKKVFIYAIKYKLVDILFFLIKLNNIIRYFKTKKYFNNEKY